MHDRLSPTSLKPAIVCILILAAAAFLPACAKQAPRGQIPAQTRFAHWHPAYDTFHHLLAIHATRAQVHREIEQFASFPEPVIGAAQLLALPPSVAPPKRALMLLRRWPRATYAQLIDDVRVLACFDEQNRLAAFELF